MQHRGFGSAGRASWDDRAAPRLGVPEQRCPDCGRYMRLVSRPTGEQYLACMDRINCGYQEVV